MGPADGARPTLDVAIERAASPDELADVRAAFAEAGVPATVRAALEFKSAESVAIAALMVTGVLTAFLSAIVAAAGNDAYAVLKRLALQAGGRRRRRGTTLWFQDDSDRHIDIAFAGDLPDEAYQSLFELDLERVPDHCIIRYEPDVADWMLVFERQPVPRKDPR